MQASQMVTRTQAPTTLLLQQLDTVTVPRRQSLPRYADSEPLAWWYSWDGAT